MEIVGIGLAVALALVHVFLPAANLGGRFSNRRCFSFAGGVSIGFVFLRVFPALSRAQMALNQASLPGFGALENSVYALALGGVTFFYGLDRLVLTSPRIGRTDTSLIFWIHIAAYALLNAIFGYMLLSLEPRSLREILVFFVAIALHFLIIDRALREHHPTLYDRQGRWLLTGTIVAGAIAATVTQFNTLAIALTGSFLAGSTILNILKRELPDPKQSCFWSFLGGATLYTGLLWLS